ncbi:unnamed protein product [marine sediment metagenome]|uniref:Uncharacterized protein n=1 Tax=marine sediment metagenome TaxID=412755 RepID=X1QYP3_9ZZZZ
MEYWIDGEFTRAWTQKAWYSHDRGVYVPKFATVRREVDRIYITEEFAYNILRPGRIFDSTNRHDMFDLCLKNIINVPWVKEKTVSFEVSL